MGQLINPLSFRLNKNKFWIIRWSTFLKTNFKYILKDDYLIFSFLNFLFYRLKKLLKKKFFFLIIDFIVLKKNNLYFFLVDYLFLNKFYKKYFKKSKKNKIILKNFKKIKYRKILKKFFIFNFFKIFKRFKYKKLTNKRIFILNFYKNLKKIKIKRIKLRKKKNIFKKYILMKRNIVLFRNFIKKIFFLFFSKNFEFNLILLILIFLSFYKKKVSTIFINNSFFIFSFLKSFLVLNIKKFLKNNLNSNICDKIIIKLKNIKNFFIFKDLKKENKFFYKNKLIKKLFIKKNYIFFLKKKNFFINLKKKNFSLKKILKRKLKKKINLKKTNLKLIFLELPKKILNPKRKIFLNLKNIYKKNRILKKYLKLEKLKRIILKKKFKKNKLNKKKSDVNNLLEKKNFLFSILNFNLKIFSIFFKFLFKKYRYNTNKVLKLLENSLISFIKAKGFIKGFKIKIKGRFTKKSRSSLSVKNIGKYSLSKINNKIVYFEENISTIYGISSFKLFFLVDNNFFYKKNYLSKLLLNQF